MEHQLSARELSDLVTRVFAPTDDDRALALIVDLPDAQLPDNPLWLERRQMAQGWASTLRSSAADLGMEVRLLLYRNVRANNADLPDTGWAWDPSMPLPATADDVESHLAQPLNALLAANQLIIAPTELSTTAPLKMLAPKLGLRAATMPGFSPEMVPALRLDYREVNRRVNFLKGLLDDAVRADFVFEVGSDRYELTLDLRYRQAHASGGLLPEIGTAGNLPSGESYIVPYEGEIAGTPSQSSGLLPVQLDGEVVLYRIAENRAVEVLSDGPVSDAEKNLIRDEPAYANLSELGLGVLAGFGVKPVGEVLLDEKLGLHIAFGRSDHFGGQVGPADFSSPEAVTHQDRVYIPELQPDVLAVSVDLTMQDDSVKPLMRDGDYVVDF